MHDAGAEVLCEAGRCPVCGGALPWLDEIRLDLPSGWISRRGRTVRLLSREAEMVAVLIEGRGEPVADERLMIRIYGAWTDDPPETDVLSQFACMGNRRLAAVGLHIARVRCYGYRLAEGVWRKRPPPRPWTEEENRRLIALRRAGKTHVECAAELERDEKVVMDQAKRLGVDKRSLTAGLARS